MEYELGMGDGSGDCLIIDGPGRAVWVVTKDASTRRAQIAATVALWRFKVHIGPTRQCLPWHMLTLGEKRELRAQLKAALGEPPPNRPTPPTIF
jgi:hypothetical protein